MGDKSFGTDLIEVEWLSYSFFQKENTMQQEVIKMYDEHSLLKDLIRDTFELIQRADNVDPIKKLIEIHDILHLNMSILQKFSKSELSFDEVWVDVPTLKYLNHLRCTLMVYHHTEFSSIQDLIVYNRALCRFIHLVSLRLKNKFDIEMPRIS